ncbi:hypothetical protein [Micavibrio aeruginosavorus]|nr:hypothetical protein [Micavibrio aeruginosavorus]
MNRLFNAIHQFNCLSGINRMYAASAMTNNDTDEFMRLMSLAHEYGRIKSVVTPQMVKTLSERLVRDIVPSLSKATLSEDAQRSLGRFIDVCRMIQGHESLQLAVPGQVIGPVVQLVLQHRRVGDLVRLRRALDGSLMGAFVDGVVHEDGPVLMGDVLVKSYRDRLDAARAVTPARRQPR